jgi:hypothetical protein
MRPTALLIPSPWSGDESDPIPTSYRWWFRLYVTTRRARHLIGLHDWHHSPLHGKGRCTWCGKVPTSP